MRQFRQIFASLFIVATLLGALHEIIHTHHHDADGTYEQSCPLYLLSQTPALPVEVFTLETVSLAYEPFIVQKTSVEIPSAIPSRNRSPPLS